MKRVYLSILPVALGLLYLTLITLLAHFWEKNLPAQDAEYIPPFLHGMVEEVRDLHPLVRWDSLWFLTIAEQGYGYRSTYREQSNFAFFPLYPMLIRAVARGTGADPQLTGVWISRLSLLLSLFLLCAGTEEVVGQSSLRIQEESLSTRERQLLFLAPALALLAFPTAFLLGSLYSESLFLVLSLSAWFFFRKERLLLSAAAALAASLVRAHGIALVLYLLAVGYGRYGKKKEFRFFLPALAGGAGLLLLSLSHALLYGDPLLYYHATVPFLPEATFARSLPERILHFPLRVVENFTTEDPWYLYTHTMELLSLALIFGGIYLLKRKKRYGEALYLLAFLLLNLPAGDLHGLTRYTLLLFPLFLLIREIAYTPLFYTIITTGALLQFARLYHFVFFLPPAP